MLALVGFSWLLALVGSLWLNQSLTHAGSAQIDLDDRGCSVGDLQLLWWCAQIMLLCLPQSPRLSTFAGGLRIMRFA